MFAEEVGDVPDALDDLVGRHAPQGAAPPAHPRPEAGQYGFHVLGDRGAHLRPQRLLVGDHPGAGQGRGRVAGQAGEGVGADGQPAHVEALGRAVVGDVGHREAGDAAVQEPRDREEEDDRPGVAVQAEGGYDVRAAAAAVVAQDLGVVPCEERLQARAALRERRRRGPAAAGRGRLGRGEFGDAEPGDDLGEAGVRVRCGRRGQGHAGTTDSPLV